MPSKPRTAPDKPTDETPSPPSDGAGGYCAPEQPPDIEANIAALRAAMGAPAPSVWHPLWFAPSVRPPRPDLVEPLAVLLVVAELADAERRVLCSALFRLMSPEVVERGLRTLRAAGYVMNDGVHVTVLKTPPREA